MQSSQNPVIVDLLDFYAEEVGGSSNNGKSRLITSNGNMFELHQSDSISGCVEIGLKAGPALSKLGASPMVRKSSTTSTTSTNDSSDSHSTWDNATTQSDQEEADQFRLEMAKQSFDTGLSYWTEAEYDLAMVEFRRSMELREDILGKYHNDTSQSYFWIGSVYYHKEQYEKALDMLCHAFQIKYTISNYDFDRVGVVTSWITKTLDALHIQLSDEDMDRMFWKSLMSGVHHEQKGDAYAAKNHHKHAIQEYRTAMTLHQRRRMFIASNSPTAKIQAKGQPTTQPDMADLHIKIGKAYAGQELWDRAMLSYRKALCVYMIRFGPHSMYMKSTVAYLRQAALGYGWHSQKVDEYLQSLETSLLHETKGDLFLGQKRFAEAIHEYERAIKLEESNVVGRLQLPSASLYCKLGSIFADQGMFDVALPQFCKALGIYHASPHGKNHPDVTNTINLLKKLLSRQAKRKADSVEAARSRMEQSQH